MDKSTEVLLTALKEAMARPGEQRLFKSGKLPGLFPGRAGLHAAAAAQALRDGLLEVSRAETRGKSVVEWVTLTPRGVNFVHEQESPVHVLRELRRELAIGRDGVPAWLAHMRQELLSFGNRLADDAQQYMRRLDSLSQRVEEALRRAEAAAPAVSDGLAGAVPWAVDALAYLERRPPGDCPLPELFAALRETHPDLTLNKYQDGLLRLHDRRALRLLPFTDPAERMPQPEHAMLDGAAVLYYAAR